MLIVCEGKLTEPSYFKDYLRENRNQLVMVEIVPDRGVPKSVVDYAADRKKQAEKHSRRRADPYLKFDEVWCVFDVDEHPHLPEALQQAKDNKIRVALSNPNFELWILLHFQDLFRHEHRDVIGRLCREHMPEYQKLVNFELLRAGYEDAVRRAGTLEKLQIQKGAPDGNPSTGVYKLTERIRELGKDNFLRQASR
ncbi:RloB family protein [Candidatus Korobacter versatilis]|uniref:RloB family protein n=1 Tax=Candidatus Korobacter versatilis TaxID=658062 RepID=UPI00067436FD|nr:RloB family protein [Candidatus Koribacter versatilis]